MGRDKQNICCKGLALKKQFGFVLTAKAMKLVKKVAFSGRLVVEISKSGNEREKICLARIALGRYKFDALRKQAQHCCNLRSVEQ